MMARNGSLSIVLIDTRNPLNIGSVARAMSNFGFFDLRLVSPYQVAFREAVSAVGAAALLERAKVCRTVGEAVADATLVVGATGLGHRRPHQPLRRLELAARLLRRHKETAPAALLFGSEKFGLSNEAISHCHWLLRIPTREGHESMNLAQAVTVCLYELIRKPHAARRSLEVADMAQAGDLERLTEVLEAVLQSSGYADYDASPTASEKTRRLVRRLCLNTRDTTVLTGMLRQVLWKLQDP
jgi:TrmH family RNA methyltransferase